jgi:Animal haem peroxidase
MPDKPKLTQPSKPGRPRGHGGGIRGLSAVSSQPEGFGRFGRMFPELAPARFGPSLRDEQAVMWAIAQTMIKVDKGASLEEAEPLDENADIAAGYTYFGQFIDHDITFDPASSLDRDTDPNAVEDFRTPRFDLDSLYGRGPDDQPYLFNPNLTFKLGPNVAPMGSPKRFDVPRAPADTSGLFEPDKPEPARALIGDKRNDENTIVVQIHGLFLRFHNAFMAQTAKKTATRDALSPEPAFATARRKVRWHYQWLVIHDFVRRIVGPKTFAEVWNGGKPDLQFYCPKDATYPFMPVEFAVAAYRLGHSMVRPGYALNKKVRGGPNRIPIFSVAQDGTELDSLNGFRPLRTDWGIDWSFFLPDLPPPKVPSEKIFLLPQPSYRLDTLLVDPLKDLPDHAGRPEDRRSLPSLNLLRGIALGLPSGQAVARRMGCKPLTDDELWKSPGNLTKSDADQIAARHKAYTEYRHVLHKNAPLWFYIMREAELTGQRDVNIAKPGDKAELVKLGGWHLGPVGGRIIAEVFIGMLMADDQSYLVQHPKWQPEIQVHNPKQGFQLSDIVRFVDAA